MAIFATSLVLNFVLSSRGKSRLCRTPSGHTLCKTAVNRDSTLFNSIKLLMPCKIFRLAAMLIQGAPSNRLISPFLSH